MVVAQPSTPASYFHLLRWHAKSPTHRPLIVLTPKSMLRLKAAASATSDFTSGSWKHVIADTTVNKDDVTTVLLVSGKLYWDLVSQRTKRSATNVAIVRVEQLYPTPIDEIVAILASYPSLETVRWVQDEPANQGPWPHIGLHLPEAMPTHLRLQRVSRKASATTAAGSITSHEAEAVKLMNEAFEG